MLRGWLQSKGELKYPESPASSVELGPTMMSTNTNRTPKSDDSPGNGAEHREEEAWSGEDDASEADGDDGTGKRKRQKTSRPLSVSCELCKSRKVCTINPIKQDCSSLLQMVGQVR